MRVYGVSCVKVCMTTTFFLFETGFPHCICGVSSFCLSSFFVMGKRLCSFSACKTFLNIPAYSYTNIIAFVHPCRQHTQVFHTPPHARHQCTHLVLVLRSRKRRPLSRAPLGFDIYAKFEKSFVEKNHEHRERVYATGVRGYGVSMRGYIAHG